MTRLGFCLQLDSICTWMVHHMLHIGLQTTRVGLCLQFESIFVAQYTDSIWCDLFDLIRAQLVGGQSFPLTIVFPAVALEDLIIYCKVTTFHVFLLVGLKLASCVLKQP